MTKKKKRKRNSKEMSLTLDFGRSNCEPTTASSKSVLGSDSDIRAVKRFYSLHRGKFKQCSTLEINDI